MLKDYQIEGGISPYPPIVEGAVPQPWVEGDDDEELCEYSEQFEVPDDERYERWTPPPNVQRWHCYDLPLTLDDIRPPTARCFILYGEQSAAREVVLRRGWYDLIPSGEYSYHTNTILDAKDGATLYEDHSGGKLSQ